MGDGFIRIAIMRMATNECDRAGDVIAFAMTDHSLPGLRWAEIVDPQVKRRLRLEFLGLEPDRQA